MKLTRDPEDSIKIGNKIVITNQKIAEVINNTVEE